tara:strand:+ start:50 stop:682 length:633 start_codon:yes stop_codon:yes gene_type:complete
MSDILRQVDEDLRKERLSNLWKKYGIYAITFVVLIFVVVAGYQIISSSDKAKNEKLLEIYLEAKNSKIVDDKISLFEELLESKNEYLSGMAELRISSLNIEKGNIDEGLLGLENIKNNKNYDPIIKDLALYLFLIFQIDILSEEKFMNHINKEMIKESKYNYLFKELISIKKLLLGKSLESKNGFKELLNLADTPSHIKVRAKKFIEIAN